PRAILRARGRCQVASTLPAAVHLTFRPCEGDILWPFREASMRALMAIGLTAALGAGVMAQAGAGSTGGAELKVGDPAPNFKLQATDGKTYQLSDFKGKESVVLAWFPKAFTQGCTIECKSLAEHGDMIKMYNAQYFMIS